MARRSLISLFAILLGVLGALGAGPRDAGAGGELDAFLNELWSQAQQQGVTRPTFDLAFTGFAPDHNVLAATGRQPEYGKSMQAYLASSAGTGRIAAGQRNAARWATTLDAIEKAFGIDRFVILAIWGAESDYGSYKPTKNVIRSLATLANAHYRDPLFRDELLAALQILEAGHVKPDAMMGSWAGAMGQCQFLPSSFLKWAVDFSGDGKRDIWSNVPDVLASIASYLRAHGWSAGLPWGFEVLIPNGFDYRRSRASFQEWAALGLGRTDGVGFPEQGEAILFFPAGAAGPGFLVTDNFVAIKRYNDSDAYALAVAHLSDRLRGLPPIRTPWPALDAPLTRLERITLQHSLARLGYRIRDFEGHLDFELRDVVRALQVKMGRVPDGYPDRALLDLVRSQSAATKKAD
jgi:membrane-bound lytic murein transglycosylase B